MRGPAALLPPLARAQPMGAPMMPAEWKRASAARYGRTQKAPPWTEAKAGQIARANRRKEPARGLEVHRWNIDPGPRQLFLQQGNLATHPANERLLLMAVFLGLVKLIPLPLDDFA